MAVGTHTARDAARLRGELPSAPHSIDQVRAVLLSLPSHGWTAGWVGRRDRALLVLSQLAGLTYVQIASLSAGDLTVVDGVASIRTPGGKTTLRDVDDCRLCGPCALARWVHALDLTVAFPDARIIATVIGRAARLTADSPHLCHSNNAITELTSRVPLMPPIDQWGHPVLAGIPRVLPAAGAGTHTRRQTIPKRVVVHQAARKVDEERYRADGLEQRVEQLLDDGQQDLT